MSIKSRRTLTPAQFESYMDFCDTLKNGSNDDTIDCFKYKFAVSEGYIRPHGKARLESAGMNDDGITAAIKGLLGAFLPHLDAGEQAIVGKVMSNLDEACSEGRRPTMDDMFAMDDDVEDADAAVVEDDGAEAGDADVDEVGEADVIDADEDEDEDDDGAEADSGKVCCKCKNGKCTCGKCDKDDEEPAANEFAAETECCGKPKLEGVLDDPSGKIPEDGNFWMALGKVTRERGNISREEMDRISSRFRPMGTMQEYEQFIRSVISDVPSSGDADYISESDMARSAAEDVDSVLDGADDADTIDYDRYARDIVGLTDDDF